ncbi:uncharacterized protein AB675_8493 [Cyphellophora attinorum]|uniref:Uncharacterized protein n=1 Tax=Cyphellophora attinorum TaxID=1664694 RepID=A0A0N1HFQ9_9EURO|nr:uncharacterized protein AB675_8493 [Phialophora attinorum]KPI44692.1 hypothetical protein AB675_8493 [Phialophora attinorum]
MNNTIIPPITAPDYGFSLGWRQCAAFAFVETVHDNQWTNRPWTTKPNGRIPTTNFCKINVDGFSYNGWLLLRTPSNLTQIVYDTQYSQIGAAQKLEYIASELRAWRRDGHEFWSEAVFFAYHGYLCMQNQNIHDLLPKMDAAIRHGMTRLLELYLSHLTDMYMTPSPFPSNVEVLNDMGKKPTLQEAAKRKPKITLKFKGNHYFPGDLMDALPNNVSYESFVKSDIFQEQPDDFVIKSNIIDFALPKYDSSTHFELLGGTDGTFDIPSASSSFRWSGSTLFDSCTHLDTKRTCFTPAAFTFESDANTADSEALLGPDFVNDPSVLPTNLNGFSPPGTVFTPSPTDSIFSGATTVAQLPDTPLSDTTFAEGDLPEPSSSGGNAPPLPLPLSADETEALFQLHTTQTLNWVRDYFLHVYARLPAPSPSTATLPSSSEAHSSVFSAPAAMSPNVPGPADDTERKIKEHNTRATSIAASNAYDPSIAVLQQYIKKLESVREVFSQWFWLNERRGPAQVKIDITACGQLVTLGKLVGFDISVSATAGHDAGKKTARPIKTVQDDHVFDSRTVVGEQEDWIMRGA